MRKVWDPEERRVAGLRVSEIELTAKIERLKNHTQTQNALVNQKGRTRHTAPKKERQLREKAAAEERTQLNELETSVSRIRYELKDYHASKWKLLQPKELQDPNHVIPQSPFKAPYPTQIFVFFGDVWQTIPPEYATCTTANTIKEAIELSSSGGIIYLPSGNFSLSNNYIIQKDLKIIGLGSQKSILFLTNDQNVSLTLCTSRILKSENCSLYFQNIDFHIWGSDTFSLSSSNVWFVECTIAGLLASHSSNLFLSKCESNCDRGFVVTSCANSFIAEHCIFRIPRSTIYLRAVRPHPPKSSVKVALRSNVFKKCAHALQTDAEWLHDHLKDPSNLVAEGNSAPICLLRCDNIQGVVCREVSFTKLLW